MQCLRYTLPCGTLLLGADENALQLCVWDFGRGKKIFKRYTQERVEWCVKGVNKILDMTVAALDALAQGHAIEKEIPMKLVGTDFQKQVWEELSSIKPGCTATYSAIAKTLGTGARAVGNAVGANPINIFVPCHRVIAADGTLGGYAGGLEAKKWLLEKELILVM